MPTTVSGPVVSEEIIAPTAERKDKNKSIETTETSETTKAKTQENINIEEPEETVETKNIITAS